MCPSPASRCHVTLTVELVTSRSGRNMRVNVFRASPGVGLLALRSQQARSNGIPRTFRCDQTLHIPSFWTVKTIVRKTGRVSWDQESRIGKMFRSFDHHLTMEAEPSSAAPQPPQPMRLLPAFPDAHVRRHVVGPRMPLMSPKHLEACQNDQYLGRLCGKRRKTTTRAISGRHVSTNTL